MDSSIKILYNDTNLFTGICDPPLISITNSRVGSNRTIGSSSTISLNGYILTTSCDENCSYTIPDNYIGNQCGSCSMQELNYKKYLLLLRLKNNIGNFQILSDDTSVFSGSYAKLETINFEDSNYGSNLPFSIDFVIYNSECWKEDFGVEEVSDEVSYAEEGCDVSLTRKISAKGFKTSDNYDNSFENACNWVKTRSGEDPCPPVLIQSYDSLFLKSINESVDRFGGIYSLDLDYIYSKEAGNTGSILKTSYEYSSGEDFSSVTVRGSIEAGINTSFDNIKERFSGLNFYNLCSEFFSGYESGILNSGALSFNLNEDDQNNIISFDATYDNRSDSDPYLIDDFSFSETLSDGKRCVTFNGEIKSNIGCRTEKNQKILEYYSGFNFDSYIREKWVEYGLPGDLDPQPQTENFSFDEYNSSINVGMTYCETNKEYPSCLSNLDYEISFKPPLTRRTMVPSCTSGGFYIMQDLGYKTRGEFSINGTAVIDNCCKTIDAVNNLIQFINQEQSLYIKGTDKIITNQSIDWTESGRNISFNYGWTYNAADEFSESFRSSFENQVSPELVDVESGILLTSINGVDLIELVSL